MIVRTINVLTKILFRRFLNFFGTNCGFEHSPELNRYSSRPGTGNRQHMDDKTGKKSKTSGAQHVVREAVSSKLKAYYEDISRQEVPQRFLDLLAELDKKDGKTG